MGINKEQVEQVLTCKDSNLIIEETVETKPAPPPRRPKNKNRHRCRPLTELQPKSAGNKLGGQKRTRRYENTCFLLSLVDDEEFGEVTITDFVESSQTVFEQLLADRDSLEIWNEFINRSGEEQELFLQQIADKETSHLERKTNLQVKGDQGPTEGADVNGIDDERIVHPANSPEASFRRISSRLRTMLRRKHLPKGMLRNHEDDLVPWFTDDPGAVFISHINCSFDRLLLHAVCQYLDLQSHSYSSEGQRQTKVENGQDWFSPPQLLLSEYLDSIS